MRKIKLLICTMVGLMAVSTVMAKDYTTDLNSSTVTSISETVVKTADGIVFTGASADYGITVDNQKIEVAAGNMGMDFTISMENGATITKVVINHKQYVSALTSEGWSLDATNYISTWTGETTSVKAYADPWSYWSNCQMFSITVTTNESDDAGDGGDDPEPATLEEGVWYLYTTALDGESLQFYTRGSTWGTRAMIGDLGFPTQVATFGDGYRLTQVDWPNNGLGVDLYADQITVAWQAYGDAEDGYIFYSANITNPGYLTFNEAKELVTTTDAEAATPFFFMSVEDYNEYLETNADLQKTLALAYAGVEDETELFETYIVNDVTDKVQNAALAGSVDGWTKVMGNRSTNFATNSYGTESYEAQGTLSQTVEGLPAGLYKLTLQGYVRNGSCADCVTRSNQGYKMSSATLSANGSYVRLMDWADERVNDSNPNSMADASAAFADGKYVNELFAIVGEDGKLDITIAWPSFVGMCWIMVKNLTLTQYAAPASPQDLPELTEDEDYPKYYYIENFRSGNFAAWTGDDSQLAQTEELTSANFFYFTGAIEDGKAVVRIHSYETDQINASFNSWTEEGVDVSIFPNPYNDNGMVIAYSSSSAWDDQSSHTKIGGWYPSASDNLGTTWVLHRSPNDDDIDAAIQAIADQDAFLTAAEEVYAQGAALYPRTQLGNEELTLSADQFSSNYPEPNEGSIAALIDNNASTFFHSQWSASTEGVHNLQVSLPENTTTEFILKYTARTSSNDHVKTMEVYGSNDGGQTYSDLLTTINLPTVGSGVSDEVAFSTGDTPYTYYRFDVTDCYPSYRKYFHFAEFHLYNGVPTLPAELNVTEESAEALRLALYNLRINLNKGIATQDDVDAVKNAMAGLKLNVADAEVTSLIGYCYEGYPASVSDEDAAAIAALLGVSDPSEVTIAAIAPDGTYVTDNNGRGDTDGWRNAAGEFVGWGTEGCTFYSQPYAELNDGVWSFGTYMGSFPDVVTAPTSFTTPIAFMANGAEVVVNFTLSYVFQTDFDYQPEVGDCDNTVQYWMEFSDTYNITAGQTAHFDFFNYTNGQKNYNNWTMAAVNSDAHNKFENPDYAEFFILRADAFGFGDYLKTGAVQSNLNLDEDIFGQIMNGAKVHLDVNFDGDVVTVNGLINGADGNVYDYNVVSKSIPADTIFLFFTTEKGHISAYPDAIEEGSEEFEIPNVDFKDETYAGTTATVDFNDAIDAIGCSLDGAIVMGLDPTTGTMSSDAMAVYDGWHNLDGDNCTWGSEGCAFCVKFYASETDNVWVCVFPGNEMDVNKAYSAYWALMNAETGSYYLYQITISSTAENKASDADGVEGVKADIKAAKVYDLSGRQVKTMQKGGIYILDGKKISVK